MKKWIMICILGISVLMTGCGNKSYKEVNYNQFMEMIENKESFVLVVGSEKCNHCDDYKKTMEDVIKDYGVTIHYINTYRLSEKEASKFLTIVNYSGTPTTVFIKEGKETSTYNRIDGAKSYQKIVEKLKLNGYIKE